MPTIQVSALQIENPVKQALVQVAVDDALQMARLNSMMLTTAALVINGAGTKVAKTGASICYAMVGGALRSISAATAMPALAGSVTNAKFNVFSLFVDSAGAFTSAMGTEGASLVAVVLAPIPVGKALVGMIVINPTGTGAFVGGTTNLDDATVVPGAIYLSPVGAIDSGAVATVVQ